MGRSRERKYQYLIKVTKPDNTSTILDVGCADIEYSPYDNYFEKRYPYPHNLTAASIYSLEHFRKRYKGIRTVSYQGDILPFDTREFSIVISNAVIEHVGPFEKQLIFVKELARVGMQFFYTTPAREFFLEMHTNFPFIHWLPDSLFDHLVRLFGKGWAAGGYMHLLRRGDIDPSSTVVGIFRGIFEGRIEETSGSVFLENEIAVGMRESIYCLQ